MKKFLFACCATLMLMLISLIGVNAQTVIEQDGFKFDIIDNEAVLDKYSGEATRTLVPVRGVFEAYGAIVEWKDETKEVIIKGDTEIVLKIGSNVMKVDGKEVVLDVAPQIINHRTLVPIRAISEGLNKKVNWNNDTKTVEIILK